jgi:hypothetical protein
MRKFYMLALSVGLLFAIPATLSAQEFPWPDLGEALVIEPGAPGTINDVIHGDTASDGSRNHNVYLLKRGATYLYTARIGNKGWPMMVMAEDGDGALPIIKALGPAPGEDEAERIFHAEGDLYIKDLVLNGFDQGGNYTDNATVRLAADSITVVCKNIDFDFNRQNNLRINAVGCKVYMENCIIANQGVSQRKNQGFALTWRGNMTPLVHMRNNTIYNMHGQLFHNRQTKRYQTFIFENNTVMNVGQQGADLGRPDSLIMKNNLFVNLGIMGDGVDGDRDNFTYPKWYMSIDSTFTDTTNTVLQDPYVDMENNYFYLDPAVAALLPDSSDKSTETMFHPYLADLMGENNMVMDEAFTFTNFPATIEEYQAYIDDYYQFLDPPAQMPQFDTDFRTLDFSYDQGAPAYSAATDGGPLGDRTWFPDWTPESVQELKELGISIFPNPAREVIYIQLDQGLAVDRVAIANVLGQEVKRVENLGGSILTVNTSGLSSGIYFVNLYENDRYLGTAKMLKR